VGSWDQNVSRDFLKILKTEGKVTDQEILARMKSGDLHRMRLSAELLEIDGETCILGVAVDITDQKRMESALLKRERELEAKSLELEEMNTALKILLKRREQDREELGANVSSNVKELVFPYIEKLKNSGLNERQRTYLSILESHIEEIGAPFLRMLSNKFADLSPTERQIAGLIKEGKRNREISEILGVSLNTVLTHRYHLRTKLGLKNRHINLVSYLKSIDS